MRSPDFSSHFSSKVVVYGHCRAQFVFCFFAGRFHFIQICQTSVLVQERKRIRKHTFSCLQSARQPRERMILSLPISEIRFSGNKTIMAKCSLSEQTQSWFLLHIKKNVNFCFLPHTLTLMMSLTGVDSKTGMKAFMVATSTSFLALV